DLLAGQGDHDVESFIHLAPGGEVLGRRRDEAGFGDRIASALDQASAAAAFDGDLRPSPEDAVAYTCEGVTIAVVPINWGSPATESGWVASRYGQRVESPVLVLRGRFACQEPFGYLIVRDARGEWD